jgi:hypothetical protein
MVPITNLNQFRPPLGVPIALDEAGDTGEHDGFRKSEYGDRDQNEQEIHGNGPGDSGQPAPSSKK